MLLDYCTDADRCWGGDKYEDLFVCGEVGGYWGLESELAGCFFVKFVCVGELGVKELWGWHWDIAEHVISAGLCIF